MGTRERFQAVLTRLEFLPGMPLYVWQDYRMDREEPGKGGFVSGLVKGVWAWTLGVLASQKDDAGTQQRHGVLFLCLAAPSTRSMPGVGGLLGACLRQRMPQTLRDHGG